jgi:hypothetical protein
VAKTKITLEIATEIAERFKTCENRQDVYKDYPYNQSSILYALKRYGLWFNKYKTRPSSIVVAVLEHREMLENGSITAYELSKRIGCTPVYVSVLAKKYSIKLFFTKHRGKRKTVPDEVAQQIIDHLKEHGGTINSSSRALGMGSQRVQQATRNYARRIGFEAKVYRVAHQRYGLWKVLPGIPEPCYTSDYRVDALCTGCGKTFRVMLCNMRAGVSSGCHVCRKNQGNIPIMCRETQEIYRSIMSMTKDLEIKNYTSVRLTLDKEGIFEYEGFTYVYSK